MMMKYGFFAVFFDVPQAGAITSLLFIVFDNQSGRYDKIKFL